MDIILFFIGIIIGAVGTLAGIGGGIFVVPILLAIYHFNSQMAIGTSLLVVAFNSFSGTIAYARYKRIYWSLGAILIISGIPGIFIGDYVSRLFTGVAFRIVFAGVLIVVAIHSFFQRNKSYDDVKICVSAGFSRIQVIISILTGFITGFIAAFLGIGGGIIHVPVLIYLLKIPVHIATATSHFILLNTVILAVAPRVLSGHIDYTKGFLLGVGALIGAQIGARISSNIRSRAIMIILSCILIVVAIRLLLWF